MTTQELIDALSNDLDGSSLNGTIVDGHGLSIHRNEDTPLGMVPVGNAVPLAYPFTLFDNQVTPTGLYVFWGEDASTRGFSTFEEVLAFVGDPSGWHKFTEDDIAPEEYDAQDDEESEDA